MPKIVTDGLTDSANNIVSWKKHPKAYGNLVESSLNRIQPHGNLISWHEGRSSIGRLVTGKGRQGNVGPNIKLSITHSFFELQTPDFAWKFVWIFRTNYKSKKVHKYS